MIIFEFLLIDRQEEFHNEKHSYIYEYEGCLTILIDGKVFFKEQGIAVLEFLRDACKWINNKNKREDMLYNCIETEDNPLISFILKKDKWYIQSPWQKFKSDGVFAREELESAIFELKHSVSQYILYGKTVL